jgi:predicted TIM-barrel fold metal-dependent hydrolase
MLGLTAGAALSGAVRMPIIDTHIHLFDPRRPQGVPWPEATSPLYQPALPERYRKVTAGLGVRGAIVIEASPWLDDNQWVLDVAAKDPIIIGVIGNLEPGKPEFAGQLERFAKHRLFRGIRFGNLWGRDLAAEAERQEFVDGLKQLAAAGLTLDTANPDPRLIHAVVRVTDRVPGLRVVIDHLPQMAPPAGDAGRRVREDLRELGKRPQVYVKLSSVFRRRANGEVPRALSEYREWLDEIAGTFGEDRVLFGSDWPNSDRWRPYGDVLRLAQEYYAGKARAAEKYFFRNSEKAYRRG